MGDRFYCPGPWRDGRATLDGDEARHLARVRRVGVGARVGLFDGLGRSASAEVVAVGRDRVELILLGESRPPDPGPLVLATAVPKGERFDWLVEKATELGVTRLVPILAERSAVDPRGSKLVRLRRVVVEACKQSGRSRLMDIEEPMAWGDWLSIDPAGAATRLLAHPGGPRLGDGPPIDLAAGVALAVGPEGGFTVAEVEAARAAGYRAVGLAATVLRIETAALSACAAALAVGRRDPGSSPDDPGARR